MSSGRLPDQGALDEARKLSDADLRVVAVLARWLHPANNDDILGLAYALRSPWRLIGVNLFVGVARGLGFAIGVTILGGALIVFILKILGNLAQVPVIGKFIAEILQAVKMQMAGMVPTHR